jgi:alkylhydroperoxidase/carboxymuconolactone decarboxylase family protein YurZ
MPKEIAVRLYQNAKYGTTYAKGQRHQALFNATADIKEPKVKYLLDFYSYEYWEFLAKDTQLSVVQQVQEIVGKDSLVSWLVRYDHATKAKTPIYGFSTLDMKTNELIVCAVDVDAGVEESWKLIAKPCKTVTGKNVAELLATNSELANW